MVRNSEYVRAYASRYGDMFPVRIASIIGIALAALWLLDWTWALNFAVCQLGLYAVLWSQVDKALRHPDAPGAFRSLKRWTEGITLALALHTAAFVLMLVAYQPLYQRHAVLLIIGNLMVGALQIHISRLSFAVAVIPPSLAFGVLVWRRSGDDVALMVCVAMFVAGVIGAAWRQMQTDRQAVELQVDLTARTAALETALTEAETDRARAERANQAKSRFLAMISHDVRTPLNIIMGVVEVLKRKKRTKAEAELVADMGDAGAMLLRLLNGALDLSRIESGQVDVRIAPVDVRAGIEGMGRVWRHRAEELNLDLVVECDGDPADFRVLTDEGRIEQVVINLLSNALKMTPRGTISLRARARPANDGATTLDFEIEDQGPGVPEAQRERIFQPFEQLDDGRAAGGAGLGLAICRSSVEAMGGALGVREAEGGGAVFWFRITAERAAPVMQAPAPTARASTGALSVLAAEDHPANRKLLAMILGRFDVEVTLVENGAEAVKAAASGRYDLILMDVMMPVMDGVAALQAIRATGDRVPVHMLTANVFEEDVARYMAAGADGVLRKPLEILALHAVLVQVGETEAPPIQRAG
jgi:signal transduction histidine kinase/ActR/RegA family two-component response regulator